MVISRVQIEHYIVGVWLAIVIVLIILVWRVEREREIKVKSRTSAYSTYVIYYDCTRVSYK